MLSQFYARLHQQGTRPTRGVSQAVDRAESDDSESDRRAYREARGRSKNRSEKISTVTMYLVCFIQWM